ncbi:MULTISPECIES: hypothetical protein [Haloferax]|uniref:Uncharacterized protein n=1 Tax=Haloferax marinum TaxID=2666143 RepID=A0A6A8G8T5_9EURY|nr:MULTISPECIES: hypothetical protein [Haloferax]KAB1198314.1 hypothetical protein Hfx1150_12645 [Haloferax sp. CBA1150]MRW97411.1 hypothetical protein [Haloferax marinum]
MRDRPLGAVVADRSDVELAAIFERIWEARGYETRVRFHGPDVHVHAEGETPEGTHRAVRLWISTSTRLTSDKMSAFVRQCDRADVEPYVAAVGRGRLEDDAHHPGLVELDVPTITVEVREAGIESFVRGFDRDDEDERPKTNWLGDPIAEDDEKNAGDDEKTAGDDHPADADERVSRRAALEKAGRYVVAGFTTYLVVERISDFVQQSPELRARASRSVSWVDSHLPVPDINPPTIEWEFPTAQPLSDDPRVTNATTEASDKPDDATTIPYADLRANPESYIGTTVTYTGRITETIEREDTRLAIVTVEDDAGRVRGDVVVRWAVGRFFDDSIGFRLLDRERIRFWGVVAGEGSLDGGVSYPRVDVTALEKA